MMRETLTLRVLVLLILPLLDSPVAVNSQECRAYNRLGGSCVGIHACPPLLNILKGGSPSLTQLRSLQRLTCGFENNDPKVCCALKDIKVNGVAGGGFPLPALTDCSPPASAERIIGGTTTSLGEYPWVVRLGYRGGFGGSNGNGVGLDYYCAGTIISPKYILTAAHCTEGLEDENALVEIRAGEWDTAKDPDCNLEGTACTRVVDVKVAGTVGHVDYSPATKHNDIALVRLQNPLNFTEWVSPVCLPFYKQYGLQNPLQQQLKGETRGGVTRNGGGKGTAIGWGRTNWNKAEGSRVLLQVQLPLRTNEECQHIYATRIRLSEKQVCAGGEGGKDSCGGDSGGPLLTALPLPRGGPKFFQTGIVSFGPVQCGVGGLPGVYTRVESYLDWILQNIKE